MCEKTVTRRCSVSPKNSTKKSSNVYVLLYVGDHDDAYKWAETKKLDVNPNTRAIQLYDMVSQEEIDEAYNSVGEDYIAVLRQAAENIEAYHKNQVRPGFIMTKENGVILGQKVTPIAAVGLYVPNGTAAYPSSLLMNCVPAKIAGCPLLVTVTPPGPDGKVDPAILAAAKIAGVDKIY